MRREDVFETELLQLSHPAVLGGFCQTLLLLYSRFVTSPAVRQFTYYVSFAPEEEWNGMWSADCTPDEVIDADFTGSGSPIALAFAGYLTFWGYGARCQEAFENIKGRAGVADEDLSKLRIRLQEIVHWRINLRRTSAFERFERIRTKVSKEIERESRGTGISSDAAKLIQVSIDEALEGLGFPLPVIA